MSYFNNTSNGHKCSSCGKTWSDQELAVYFQKRLGGSFFGASSVVSLAGVFSGKGLAFCPGCGGLTVKKGQ